jgi:hypothetical protein
MNSVASLEFKGRRGQASKPCRDFMKTNFTIGSDNDILKISSSQAHFANDYRDNDVGTSDRRYLK